MLHWLLNKNPTFSKNLTPLLSNISFSKSENFSAQISKVFDNAFLSSLNLTLADGFQ